MRCLNTPAHWATIKDLEKWGKTAPCADRAGIVRAMTRHRAPFFLRINEDSPAFRTSFVNGNFSGTRKRGLPGLSDSRIPIIPDYRGWQSQAKDCAIMVAPFSSFHKQQTQNRCAPAHGNLGSRWPSSRTSITSRRHIPVAYPARTSSSICLKLRATANHLTKPSGIRLSPKR